MLKERAIRILKWSERKKGGIREEEKEKIREKYYSFELDEIYQKFQTNASEGLKETEALSRLEQYGPNEIPKVSKGFIKIYLAPLFNWLIVIYLIGALILFIASFFGEGDIMFIGLTLSIVVLNCIVAIIQQYRATKKLNALREMTAPTTTVIRGGEKKEIPTKDLVVGDLVVLSQGDKIPADSRIIQSSNLEINEAALTGESDPVKKLSNGKALTKADELAISEQANMVFYGTFITTGNGTAIAVHTGGDTEIGKISHELGEAGTSEIPIRQKMNNFGKWMGLIVFALWFIILIFIWIVSGFTRLDVVLSLNSALDLLPLNIPLLTTIVLLTGVLAMARRGVIIRNLASVDSLGRVSIVCSDKTGTLTKNQMSVQNVWSNGTIFKVTGAGYTPTGEIINMDDPKNPVYLKHIDSYPVLKKLLIAGFLNNNSALVKSEIEMSGKTIYNWSVIGSPTEGALMVLFQKGMGDYLFDEYEVVKEYPFDSKIKRMTKIFRKKEKFYSFTKGASEILIPLCEKIVYNDTEVEFSIELKQKVMDEANEYAAQGYRILSLCYKKFYMMPSFKEEDSGRDHFESEMVYLGFVTILDPPREGVKKSVEECRDAGVNVIMITGDSPTTAKSIAKQISIITNEDEKVVEGKDIKDIRTFEEFNNVKVFARVSPTDKEIIVEQYQKQKKVVAMTGDGVNDALALNMADAGIAMGIQGTDVAKEASDMVISDDSFNSIVDGIHQGRGIFSKIRSMVFFFICINVFEGIVQFILAVIFNLPYFLTGAFYMQWIFLSITLHTFPGLVLTFDMISDDVMDEKPRDEEEILSKDILYLLLAFGALLSIAMVITYFTVITGAYPVFPENHEFGLFNDFYLYSNTTIDLTPGVDLSVAKTLTMLMATLFFCESFLIFQIRRPNKSLIKSIKEDSNKRMYLIIGLLFGVFLLIMYVPNIQVALAEIGFNFMFMYLTALDWLICFLISMICVLSFEVVKYYARMKGYSF